MSDRRKAVVLLSGGLDSATVLAIAKQQGFVPYTLAFDYSQRHRWELHQAQLVATAAGAARHQVVKFDLRAFGGMALTSDIEVPKGRDVGDTEIPITYVPARRDDFSVVRPGLGGADVAVQRHFYWRECARLQRLSGLPAGIYRSV